jgi:hypothetical protein
MGQAVDDLVGPYLDDERRYIRRRAGTVAELSQRQQQ